MFETRVPVLVLEKTYLPDSGGPGQHRGGLGQRVRFRKLEKDGLGTTIGFFPDVVSQDGLFGGKPGTSGGGRVTDASGETKLECGNGNVLVLTDAKEIIEVTIAGGSGYGDPSKRDPRAIEHDLALGLVTEDGARRDYGYSREGGTGKIPGSQRQQELIGQE